MGRKKYTVEDIIKQFQDMHGTVKYDYSHVVYKGVKKKVKIYCNTCTKFFNQSVDNHKHGQNCPTCSIKSTGNKNRKTAEQFIISAKKVHYHNAFDYSKVVYYNNITKVDIKCNTCNNTFKQTPANHISGKGCPYCNFIIIGNRSKLTKKEFVKRAIVIHGKNKYDYSHVVYKSTKEKVKIKCLKCSNIFMQSPNSHIHGKNGCPHCKNSNGEVIIVNILTSHNVIFEQQKRFNTCKNKRPLPFDFYLPSQKVLIEFDGIQHFQSGGRGLFKNRSLKEIQKCDAIKTKWAADNGYTLVRIPYTEIDRIEEILLPYIT